MWGEQFTSADAVYAPAKTMGCVISALNGARDRYLDLKSRGSQWEERAKQAWWQMVIAFVVVYLCVYALIGRICQCIEHCATARAYSRFRENGVLVKMDNVEAGIKKI